MNKLLQETEEPSRRQKAILRDYFNIPKTGTGSKPRLNDYINFRKRYNTELTQVKGYKKYKKTLDELAK